MKNSTKKCIAIALIAVMSVSVILLYVFSGAAPPVQESPLMGSGNQRGHTIGRLDCGGLFYTDRLIGFVHIGVTEEELVQAIASINGYVYSFTTIGWFIIRVPISTELELRSMVYYLINTYPYIFHIVDMVDSFAGIDLPPTEGGEVVTNCSFNTTS